MVIIYRLQGLDGEATEERISSLNNQEEEEGDPEEVYKATLTVGRSGGLELCLDYLRKILDLHSEKEVNLDDISFFFFFLLLNQ